MKRAHLEEVVVIIDCEPFVNPMTSVAFGWSPEKNLHFYMAGKFDKGTVWIENKEVVGSYAE